MGQLRKDPVTSRWVIMNVENPMKPESFSVLPHQKSSKTCPFCPGNESMTPSEIIAYGRKTVLKDAVGWQLRVVPNKFPALRIEESTDKYGIGVYDKLGGFGAHEVIIETPDHEREIANLAAGQIELILRAYVERCLDLKKDPRFKYLLIFKNYGGAAGASLEHAHSQLIALPVVPSRVLSEVKGAIKYYEYTDRCIYCDMINQERAEKKLSVFENDDFLAFCPFASRFPFETWILPKWHAASFEQITADAIKSLVPVLKTVFLKIKKLLSDPSYNFMIHTMPVYSKEAECYHWHIEITPHLTSVAGFELGTGFYLNPTPPELAAETLRACVL